MSSYVCMLALTSYSFAIGYDFGSIIDPNALIITCATLTATSVAMVITGIIVSWYYGTSERYYGCCTPDMCRNFCGILEQ